MLYYMYTALGVSLVQAKRRHATYNKRNRDYKTSITDNAFLYCDVFRFFIIF